MAPKRSAELSSPSEDDRKPRFSDLASSGLDELEADTKPKIKRSKAHAKSSKSSKSSEDESVRIVSCFDETSCKC
jgi:hypothetical protein